MKDQVANVFTEVVWQCRQLIGVCLWQKRDIESYFKLDSSKLKVQDSGDDGDKDSKKSKKNVLGKMKRGIQNNIFKAFRQRRGYKILKFDDDGAKQSTYGSYHPLDPEGITLKTEEQEKAATSSSSIGAGLVGDLMSFEDQPGPSSVSAFAQPLFESPSSSPKS